MPRGRSASPYRLQERKTRAFEMFAEGRSNRDVCRALRVTDDTAGRYRKEYESHLRDLARSQPELLQDALLNTLRNLEELELIRKRAWRDYNRAETNHSKAQFLKILLSAQEQRARLFGVLGIKADYAARVESIMYIADRLMDFMGRELCDHDRAKLEHFLTHGEMARYVPDTEPLDAEVVAELIAVSTA